MKYCKSPWSDKLNLCMGVGELTIIEHVKRAQDTQGEQGTREHVQSMRKQGQGTCRPEQDTCPRRALSTSTCWFVLQDKQHGKARNQNTCEHQIAASVDSPGYDTRHCLFITLPIHFHLHIQRHAHTSTRVLSAP